MSMGQKVSAATNQHAPGGGLNGRYDTAAAYFQNALMNPQSFNTEQRTKYEELRNYSSQTGSEGGFLIPEEWRGAPFGGPPPPKASGRPPASRLPPPSPRPHPPPPEVFAPVRRGWGRSCFLRTGRDA